MAHLCVWHDSWPICVCDMTHGPFVCVTWLMAHLCVWHDSWVCHDKFVWHDLLCFGIHCFGIQLYTYECQNSLFWHSVVYIWMPKHSKSCHTNLSWHSYVYTFFGCVFRDSFICATWRTYREIIHPYVCHGGFICMTRPFFGMNCYRVTRTHTMHHVARLFPQKSHQLQGSFCRKRRMKIRHPMGLRYPVCFVIHMYDRMFFGCVSWLIRMCDIRIHRQLIHLWVCVHYISTTPSLLPSSWTAWLCRDSFICVTSAFIERLFIHTCDTHMNESQESH